MKEKSTDELNAQLQDVKPEQIDKCNSLGIAFSVNSFKIQNRGD